MSSSPPARPGGDGIPVGDAATPAPRARARTAGVTVVCLAAGLLLGTSAALARQDSSGVGVPGDLVELITARDGEVRELSEEAERLEDEVSALRAERANSQTAAVIREADGLALEAGLAAVSGPAVQVTLDDAGYSLDTLPEGYSVDDVVVHQQDLQGVVNALWAGGAEAVMVEDQRIVSTSAVMCVGNTLYLHGRVYSPPFTITAVGEPERLLDALDADAVVTTYRQWADAIGLGYEVEQLGETQMPAYVGTGRPEYARIAGS